MKKFLIFILLIILSMCLSSCLYYDPPEGWTRKHHTYDEVLAYAKQIDKDAVVYDGYVDLVAYNIENIKDNRKYREWNAIIKGVSCHVASVSTWVFNSGIAAGEFCRDYYRIETDYDFIIAKQIITEKYLEWHLEEDSPYEKYNEYNTLWVDLQMEEYRELNEEELEYFWNAVCNINSDFEKSLLKRKLVAFFPSPQKWYRGDLEAYVVKIGHSHVEDFTADGKVAFFEEYRENWNLLNSDLPIYDD